MMNMLQKIVLTLTAFVVSILMNVCSAQEGSAANNFSDLLKKINTYSANFAQNIRDGDGKKVSNTHGELKIERPGKFYWKSTKPDPVLIVGDGKFLWTYDMELEQVTKQDLHEVLRNSPAGLLAGSLDKLTEEFDVSAANKNECNKNID